MRMMTIFKWASASVWAGETAVNTLHFDVRPTGSQPPVNAGPITTHTFDVNDEGGTFTYTTGSGVFTVERGWSVGGATQWDDVFKGCLGKWSAWYSASQARMAGNLELDSIRFYPLGNLGRSVSLSPAIARPNSTISPTGTTDCSPDVAICLSLYTALKTKRGRGRYYFGPCANSPIGDSGIISSSVISNLGLGMQTYLTDLRDVTSGGAPLVDFSLSPIVLHRAAPFNQAAVINQVRVGDEIDVQERRTKRRPETFVNYAVT